MLRSRAALALGALALLLPAFPAAALESPEEQRPRLVLLVVVDQLRGDRPWSALERLPAGGVRKLLEEGVAYLDAHYAHAITETAVGHATLVTGALPAQHGIVGNDWRDPWTGKLVENCVDEEHPLVGRPEDKRLGRSPRRLLSSTIGDQLALASAGRSKVFGVSIKDRSAILTAGRAGKAFWLARDSGEFTSSTYYDAELPAWARAWNERRPAAGYAGREWALTTQPGESAEPAQAFRHALGAADSPGYLMRLLFTPFADELLLDFATALIEGEELGADEHTDFLAIGFSASDAIGHMYGPSSPEAEQNLLRLDRTLAALLQRVDERVGPGRTLVVLSSDHGIAESPERMAQLGFDARRLTPAEVLGRAQRTELSRRCGTERELVRAYEHPYVYLDLDALRELGLEQQRVERELALILERQPGVARAFAMSAIGEAGDDPIARRVRASWHPARSGQVHVVLEAYSIVVPPLAPLAATHGSPWSDDTHVPLVLAGWRMQPRRVARRVGPEDLAPTLAALLHVAAPSGCSGALLAEVLELAGR